MKVFYYVCFFLRHAVHEMCRRKFHFCLAFLSCFIVTLVAAIIGTVLDHAPLIFLKLAESNAGEIDIRLEPGPSRSLLNFTQVQSLLGSSVPMGPRIIFKQATAGCFSISCVTQDVNIVFIDTTLEQAASIGQDYPYAKLPMGSCLLAKKTADTLGLRKGDSVKLMPNEPDFYYTVAAVYNSQANATFMQMSMLTPFFEVKIADVITDMNGKLPDSSNSKAVFMEMDTALQLFNFYLTNTSLIVAEFSAYLETTDPSDFSTEIVMSMPSPRTDSYMSSNYDAIQNTVTKYASKLLEQLGFYPIDMSVPVLQELNPLQYVQIFLGILLNLVLFILFFLSVILIYSLLMISVETKTYELGVIRVLGLNKVGLLLLILTHTLLFVIPAIVLGIVLSIPANSYISNMFKQKIGTGFSPLPTSTGAGNAILLGFLLPIIASMMPLYTLLTQELSESLDISHSKSKAVSVKIDINNWTAKLTLLTFGVVTVMFGISIYYLLPLALLSMNISLFLGIFLGVLIAFLLGLVLLSLNAQFFIERVIVYTLLIWERASMKLLILKNMAAHRIRNRKTTIMYALSLAFIIFLMVNFDMQISSSMYGSLRANGQRMVVQMSAGKVNYGLPINALGQVLANHKETINSVAWASVRLDTLCVNADAVLVKNAGKLYEYTARVYAVTPNIFDVLDSQFLDIDSTVDSGLSLGNMLYTGRGSQGAIMGTAFKDLLELGLNKNDTFLVEVYDGKQSVFREMRPVAFLSSAPGFTFSKYTSKSTQSLLVSFPVFYDLAQHYLSSISSIPIYTLYINLATSDSVLLDSLYADLQKTVSYSSDISIYDYRDALKTLNQSASLMSLVFFIVTLVAMFLCFFSLVASMIANIFEQSKELAVLRAIGMTRLRLCFLYVYESFVVVMTSGIMGIGIGTAVAWTMWAQQMVFTDLPVPFQFPYTTLAAVLIGSVVCSFASSFFPAWTLLKKPVAEIMRLT